MLALTKRPLAAWRWMLVAAVALHSATALAQAAAKPAAGIYTCIDDRGRRLTADRPIPECAHREQQVLNSDGSPRGVHAATLTVEERAQKEARERATAELRAAQADVVRRDRHLTARYPDEAAHNRAREAALDTVRLAVKASEIRLRELAGERKPLLDEAEFYKGKTLPSKLRAALDANDAALEAQRSSTANQEAEVGRINKLYDAELDRLRKLWSGAPAGSLGPAPGSAGTVQASAGARPASAATKTPGR